MNKVSDFFLQLNHWNVGYDQILLGVLVFESLIGFAYDYWLLISIFKILSS